MIINTFFHISSSRLYIDSAANVLICKTIKLNHDVDAVNVLLSTFLPSNKINVSTELSEIKKMFD